MGNLDLKNVRKSNYLINYKKKPSYLQVYKYKKTHEQLTKLLFHYAEAFFLVQVSSKKDSLDLTSLLAFF